MKSECDFERRAGLPTLYQAQPLVAVRDFFRKITTN
jgi:hypothetical protein